jgi:hypothetical protein
MSVPAVLPPVSLVDQALSFADRSFDLTTRAVVVAVVPTPRWGREAEVLAGLRQAAEAGADVVEVPSEPRLLGPAAAAQIVPVAARVDTVAAARAAWSAGARLLLVPDGQVAPIAAAAPDAAAPDAADPAAAGGWQLATLVTSARAGRDAVDAGTGRPVALDVAGLAPLDGVSEASLALSVGVRIVRTSDVRRTRRVTEVMGRLLEARR